MRLSLTVGEKLKFERLIKTFSTVRGKGWDSGNNHSICTSISMPTRLENLRWPLEFVEKFSSYSSQNLSIQASG